MEQKTPSYVEGTSATSHWHQISSLFSFRCPRKNCRGCVRAVGHQRVRAQDWAQETPMGPLGRWLNRKIRLQHMVAYSRFSPSPEAFHHLPISGRFSTQIPNEGDHLFSRFTVRRWPRLDGDEAVLHLCFGLSKAMWMQGCPIHYCWFQNRSQSDKGTA
jgi:hypothetical protein